MVRRWRKWLDEVTSWAPYVCISPTRSGECKHTPHSVCVCACVCMRVYACVYARARHPPVVDISPAAGGHQRIHLGGATCERNWWLLLGT